MSTPEAALRALGGSAGGYGVGLALFALLAAVGAWTLPRTFAALGLLLIAAPPLALAVFGSDKLSPRHLVFVLPVWTTFVATGLSRLPARLAVTAVAIAAAVLAPTAVTDPRTNSSDTTHAAAWVRSHVRAGDVLYPYSPVFLTALPQASVAHALPREPVALARILRRTHSRRTLVAIPDGRSWKVIRVPGPFTNVPAALAHAVPHLHGIARAAALQLYGASSAAFPRKRS
jgi:hypothetical protein